MTFHVPPDGRQSVAALAIRRGVCRLLQTHRFVPVAELGLPDGRRADLAALGPQGEVWIVEIKSCLADFQADRKWPDYRAWSDRLFFAVDAEFPKTLLPEDAGLFVADAYGGAVLREAPYHRMAPPARKAMTLAFAYAAAARLHRLVDPEAGLALGEP